MDKWGGLDRQRLNRADPKKKPSKRLPQQFQSAWKQCKQTLSQAYRVQRANVDDVPSDRIMLEKPREQQRRSDNSFARAAGGLPSAGVFSTRMFGSLYREELVFGWPTLTGPNAVQGLDVAATLCMARRSLHPLPSTSDMQVQQDGGED